MTLTSPQLVSLKSDILAKMAPGGPLEAQAGSSPDNPDANAIIAAYYKQISSPNYYVWRTSISRADVYHKTSPAGTTWSWSTYKAQSPSEQGAWTQMFMGDACPIGLLNFRQGIAAIFTGSAPQTAQRDHCFASGKRPATNSEKLFATVITPPPPANTGNDVLQPRGSVANPDNLGSEDEVTPTHIEAARTLPPPG